MSELLNPTVRDARMRQVELVISRLLRIGVVSSLLIVATGVVISFAHHPEYLRKTSPMHRVTLPGGAAFPSTLRDVLVGLRTLRGQSIVMVGLLLLIATPVMRVAVSIVGFIYERDRIYVIITTVVLILLLLSFVLGKVE